jgi:FkbM family methyltransferase
MTKPIVFCAGAHKGEEFDGWFRRGYDIVAIEPQEELCEKLRKKYPSTAVINAALWKEMGKREIFYGGYTSLATLREERTWNGRFKDYGWDHKKTINTTTLDTLIDFFGVPDALHMDIEGSEKYALKGLSQPIRVVAFEYDVMFLEDAIKCVKMLAALGEYVFSIRIGESTTYMEGLDHDEAAGTLTDLARNPKNWGMIDAIIKEKA